MTRKSKPEPRKSPKPVATGEDSPSEATGAFPIVGIGASAGGLDAFKSFFQATPPDSGMAFVLVQHLDPTHESMMTDLLSKYTAMRVVEIEDGMVVTPNMLYMIPPNKYVHIKDGRLRLIEPVTRRGMRMPIDYFFHSMAEALQERAICIVLSGTGADGTAGLRAIKGEGGTALVQAPETAQYDGMPRNAVATGLVDFILPVTALPGALVGFVSHSPWFNDSGQAVPEVKPDDFQSILAVLRARTNHDFTLYKKGTLIRRIHRRMGLRQMDSYASYLELLKEDVNEVSALLRDLLISVTAFFRDPDAWAALEEQVIPRLISGKDAANPVRIWVAGCCSGEEAYSLAILILEALDRQQINCPVQIFASDIDEHALETARNGLYSEGIVADVSPGRLQRFFEHEGGFYRVTKRVRDMIVFANQNLIRDPPFSKLDFISCRNLLIYLDGVVQKQVINLMHFALIDNGFLFLGPSESVSHQDQLFEPVSKRWRIFRRIGVSQRNFSEFPHLGGSGERGERLLPALVKGPTGKSITTLAHEVLLNEYVPACALVDRRGEAFYFHGPISNYLKVIPGEPTRDIAEMARGGLSLKVRSTLHNAIVENKTVKSTARLGESDYQVLVEIKARPLQVGSAEGILLVTFETLPEAAEETVVPLATEQVPEELRQLEHALKATREDLQSTIEELETSNEELKASNEEVMSMNEELQSTNEELETSKEELQSLNEELTTVNNELQARVVDLEAANNDIANLLNSTEVATIFLDRSLCVRRFTPRATRLFRLIPTDVGRQAADIALRFKSDDLLTRARQVLRTLQPYSEEVFADDGSCYIARVLPYRTADDHIDGVVLTFVDISELKHYQSELAASEERFSQFMKNSPVFVCIKDDEGRHVYLNETFRREVGKDTEDWLGKTDAEIWPAEVAEDLQRNDQAVLASGQVIQSNEALRLPQRQGMVWRTVKFPFKTADGKTFLGCVGVDITELEQLGVEIERQRQQLSNIIEGTRAGTWEWNVETGALAVNARWRQMVGYQPDDLMPITMDTWRQLAHPDDLAEFDRKLQGIFDGLGDFYELEIRMRRRNGDWVWILDRGSLISRLGDGRPAVMAGIHIDITERKLAREMVELERRRAVELYRLTPAMLHSMDSDMRMVAVSDYWLEVMGYTRDEIIGQHPSIFLTPDSLEFAEQSAWPGFFEQGSARNVEYQYVTKAGEVIDVLVSSAMERDAGGKPLRTLTAVEDVTQRKRAEKQLQASRDRLQGILTGTKAATWEWNLQTGEVQVDESWAQMLGYELDTLSPMSLSKWRKMMDPDDVSRLDSLIAGYVANPGGYAELESRMQHKDGSWRWVRDHGGVSEWAENGEPVWMVGIRVEVTELKRIEADLAAALTSVRQTSAIKDAIIKTISRDLRSPLNAVVTLTKTLSLCDSGPERERSIKLLTQSAADLESTIQKALGVTRLVTGAEPIRADPLNPDELLDSLVRRRRVRNEDSKVTLSRRGGQCSVQLHGDTSRIMRSLDILIDNAYQYTVRGSVTVRCRIATTTNEFARVRFEVEDTGRGIEKERLASLFHRFDEDRPGDQAERRRSGIALSLMRILIEQMKGDFGVTSTLGEGSCFWFEVPLARQAPSLSAH